jgi:hypothetical protein
MISIFLNANKKIPVGFPYSVLESRKGPCYGNPYSGCDYDGCDGGLGCIVDFFSSLKSAIL